MSLGLSQIFGLMRHLVKKRIKPKQSYARKVGFHSLKITQTNNNKTKIQYLSILAKIPKQNTHVQTPPILIVSYQKYLFPPPLSLSL